MKSITPILYALSLLAMPAALAEPAATTTESVTMQAKGRFDVKMNPQQADNPQAEAAGLMRMSLDKHYHGGLEATGQGEMLAAGDGNTSGAYVAVEKVEGTLDGRQGAFMLVHTGIMHGGTPAFWSVTIVPDSGTGELQGIAGEMTITITDGAHDYALDYRLP